MQFQDKLDFLMKITQTSNKQLAEGIAVDPSLVSLLRSGKRRQPHNRERQREIAQYFAARCGAAYQRNALAEMLGRSVLSPSMPAEVLADYLCKWLCGEQDMVEQIIDGIEKAPPEPEETAGSAVPVITPGESKTEYFFGDEGRRQAMRCMMSLIREVDEPGELFVASDDNLEWLFTDYSFTRELQACLTEILQQGYTFNQIMPSVNFLNSYVESLEFWLPIYITGGAKVYYYPRLRDNLYRHATIILPGHCVQITTGIGLGNGNHITMVSTDPALVRAYTEQYEEYFSLCRPALAAHTDPKDFIPGITDIFSASGDIIQKVWPLSATTAPAQLLEDCIRQSDNSFWKYTCNMYLNELPAFEKSLKIRRFTDICRLAEPEEVREGKVPVIAASYDPQIHNPVYTPESYAAHLKNILRLSEKYENYQFIPISGEKRDDYNLIVNEAGTAVLVRHSKPCLMLEIHRPEIVQAFCEHMRRYADRIGCGGIQRTKMHARLHELINELQG